MLGTPSCKVDDKRLGVCRPAFGCSRRRSEGGRCWRSVEEGAVGLCRGQLAAVKYTSCTTHFPFTSVYNEVYSGVPDGNLGTGYEVRDGPRTPELTRLYPYMVVPTVSKYPAPCRGRAS